MTRRNNWDRYEEIGRQAMEAEALAQQANAQRDREREANAAYERMGPLARSIQQTVAAGLKDPDIDNKPRLQQLHNAVDQAADTYARGRMRER